MKSDSISFLVSLESVRTNTYDSPSALLGILDRNKNSQRPEKKDQSRYPSALRRSLTFSSSSSENSTSSYSSS